MLQGLQMKDGMGAMAREEKSAGSKCEMKRHEDGAPRALRGPTQCDYTISLRRVTNYWDCNDFNRLCATSDVGSSVNARR